MKKILIVISLFFGLAAVFTAPPAHAQTASPVYIVQDGDTLIGIALQFGVTVNDLVAANGLVDPNSLRVGDRLVIPGLDGVEGVLETIKIAYGENLRSYSREFQIAEEQLAHINRIVSPAELVVGSPLILPVQENVGTSFTRMSLGVGQSLLEQAVLTNQAPWRVVAFNRLASTAYAIPGDVLLLPGGEESGPGAIPAPVMVTAISRFGQGKTSVVRLETSQAVTLNGKLGDKTLKFYEARAGEYVALQGIYALQNPGMIPLSVSGTMADGRTFSFSQMVYVDDRNYLFEYLSVPPDYIDPDLTASEGAVVAELVAPQTEERYWDGVFTPPSPYRDCLNSSFGNRRSYNGSAFDYFHGGVDYCGGTGTDVYAPAPGRVVFSGLMDIRGNYTIIDHGWGIYSGYMHQSERLVSQGDWVETGQLIGKVGSTGRSTGPHLHWEIWVGGVLVDPLDWLSTSYP